MKRLKPPDIRLAELMDEIVADGTLLRSDADCLLRLLVNDLRGAQAVNVSEVLDELRRRGEPRPYSGIE